MPALLPFLSGTLLILILYTKQKSWRSATLSGAIGLGVFVAVSTEILSLLHLINLVALASIWLLLTSFLLFTAIKNKALNQISNPLSTLPWNQLEPFDKLLCIGTGIIVLTVGVIAIVAPPNNWDSMSYVMPRVMHWMQAHSVEHYPTHYTPQLYNGTGAEFALLHLQILSGGDRLANVPQWLSTIGCLLGVSLIAKQLGADLRGQVFSMTVCATIPVGILQASNSKNTYIIAFWLVCLTYYSILLIKNRPTWPLVLAATASFGLAVLTKGTAYVYGLPFIVWLSLSVLARLREKIFYYSTGAGIVFLIINLGHYCRNFLTFGSPTSTYPYRWNNEIYSLPAFASSTLKNISLHLIPPFFGREKVDLFVTEFHRLLGLSPVDSRLNLFLGGYQPEVFSTQSVQLFEDTAGNSFHFWLVLLTIALFLKDKNLRKNKLLAAYCLSTILSFLTFCLLIKWQIWHSRLHLPTFVLICPFVGIVLAQALRQRIAQYVLLILLLTASPYLLLNETRSIATTPNIFNTDRSTQYFASRSNLQADYVSVANLVSQSSCDAVGLIQRPDAWEYPLWVLLNQQSHRAIRIENVSVTNPSKLIAQSSYYRSFQPCLLVSIGMPLVQQVKINTQVYEDSKWRNTNRLDPMQVFFKR